jgi:hypothetical protein
MKQATECGIEDVAFGEHAGHRVRAEAFAPDQRAEIGIAATIRGESLACVL